MQNFKDGKIPVGDNKAISLYNLATESLASLYRNEELDNISTWLLEHFTGLKKSEVLMNPDVLVNQSTIIHFSNALDELKKGVPVQYVIGMVSFYQLSFHLNRTVLIPRPETEELVDMIVKENNTKEGLKIIDIGTGSGCISISLAKHVKGSLVTAIDISADALNMARKNAQANDVQNIEFLETNFLHNGYFTEKEFDIIVSNPPYIALSEKEKLDRNVVDFEPGTALFVPDNDPLVFYRAIAVMAQTHLKQAGLIYLEVNERLGKETAELFSSDAFSSVILVKDMFGKNRFIKAEKR